MSRSLFILISSFIIFLYLIGLSNADVFTIASGQGEISIGGISGQQSGVFTGIPAVTSPTPPSSNIISNNGGSGGLIIPQIQNLIINPTSYNLPASVGIQSSGKIFLFNNGSTSLNISINLVSSENIIHFNVSSFSLASGGQKFLEFSINPPNKSGIYTGEILFSAGGAQTIVPFVVNVASGQSLFDVKVDTPSAISFGENLTAHITLAQMGSPKTTDVTLNYIIKDFKGNVYLQQTETLAILNQDNLQKLFDVSKFVPGDYVLGVEAIYSGGIATASSKFSIAAPGQIITPVQNPLSPLFIQLVGVMIALIALVMVIIINIILYRKKGRRR